MGRGSLGIGDGRFGLLFSVGSIAGILTVLFSGVLIDRWGPLKVLRVTLAGAAVALVIIALAGKSWLVMLGALALWGLFRQPLGIAVNTYLIRLFPRSRRRVLSLNLAATSMGGFLFPALAEFLLLTTEQGVPFATVLHLPYAVAAFVLLAGSCLFRPRVRFGGTAAPARRWQLRDMLVPRRHVLLIVLMTMHGAADSALHVWMARFLGSASFESQPLKPGFVLSGYAVAYLLARSLLALVPEHRGRRVLMVLPGLLGGTVLLAGILSRNYLITAGAYVVGASLWSVEYPVILSVIATDRPERFGAAMALQQVSTSVVIFALVGTIGWLTARLGDGQLWQLMLIPSAFFPCIGIGALLWLSRHGKAVLDAPGAEEVSS